MAVNHEVAAALMFLWFLGFSYHRAGAIVSQFRKLRLPLAIRASWKHI
jgi:hypothetical protein